MKKVEATFGAGCFWCIEACFKEVEGIISVVPGYMGGRTKNPTYNEVCSGTSGHAEVARVVYNEDVLSFDKLLELFFFIHNPTQLNRQGNDVGTQYRSVVFFQNEEQMEKAQVAKDKLDQSGIYKDPVVTEITRAQTFYPAEAYHQNYLENNPENPYCQMVVKPKVDKFKEVFQDLLDLDVNETV